MLRRIKAGEEGASLQSRRSLALLAEEAANAQRYTAAVRRGQGRSMTAGFNPYLGLSYPELAGRRKDYAKLLHAAQAARKAAERNLTLIVQAMDGLDPHAAEYEASDHAVIRYLERVHGTDIAAIRELIRVNCAAAKPLAGNGLRADDGHIYCINGDGFVTTVLPIGAVLAELEEEVAKPARSGDKKRARRTKLDILHGRSVGRG
jgi:hypothetical protein